MISVNYNANAAAVSRKMNESAERLGRAQQVAASGSRVNDPSADPASAAVGSVLLSDSVALGQVMRNASNALSITNFIASGLETVNNILTALRQNALQAANGDISDTERGMIQSTVTALKDQLVSIVDNTQWLGVDLFKAGSIDFQVGLKGDATSRMTLPLTDLTAISSYTAADVSTATAAQTYLTSNETDRGVINTGLSEIGATQSRLNHLLNNVASEKENKEVANMTLTGADLPDTLREITTESVKLDAATSIFQQSLKKQAELVQMIKSVNQSL